MNRKLLTVSNVTNFWGVLTESYKKCTLWLNCLQYTTRREIENDSLKRLNEESSSLVHVTKSNTGIFSSLSQNLECC